MGTRESAGRDVPARRRLALAVCAAWIAVSCGRDATQPRNVVVISIDTCRADHLSAYGYSRPTSPFLEELAARGVLFERAFSQVPDTTPSHASLFTSTYPDTHGSANGVPLGAGSPTLAELLGAQGLRTAAFVSGLTMTAKRSGLDRGFDVYDDAMTRNGTSLAKRPNERTAEETTDRALAWLSGEPGESGESDAPFFLFVHYFDPHAIYMPPAPYDAMFAPAADEPPRLLAPEQIPEYARIDGENDFAVYVARYDGEIRYVDDQIRRIFDELERRGLADTTLFVVTSDHGEDMGEHDTFFTHGWRLYDTSLHVPLILSCPASLPGGRRVTAIAESIDVVPTVLELMGAPLPAQLDGVSLLQQVEGERAPDRRYSFSRTTKSLTYLQLEGETDVRDYRALRGYGWKYILSEDGETRFLFDLRSGAGEGQNALAREPKAAASMEKLLRRIVDEARAKGTVDPASPAASEELLEELRALGYVR